MQPIDWAPSSTQGYGHDDDLPGHRRMGSGESHGSFHSGSEHGQGNYNYGTGSDRGHGAGLVGDLPSHDFTAGPAHLAPGGGYADLTRGPSPQPQMQEAALTRGPSLTRGVSFNRGNDLQRGPSLNRNYDQSAYPSMPPPAAAYDYNGHTGGHY